MKAILWIENIEAGRKFHATQEVELPFVPIPGMVFSLSRSLYSGQRDYGLSPAEAIVEVVDYHPDSSTLYVLFKPNFRWIIDVIHDPRWKVENWIHERHSRTVRA